MVNGNSVNILNYGVELLNLITTRINPQEMYVDREIVYLIFENGFSIYWIFFLDALRLTLEQGAIQLIGKIYGMVY